jgi:polyhydroxyalkanoate synthesis regulator phasin
MSNSRMKILEMLAEGKITADEASALLEKISASEKVDPLPLEKTTANPAIPRYLRVVVDSADGDKVNVKVPMSLIKTGIKLSALMPAEAANAMKDQGIDLSMLRDLPADELIEALRELEVNVDSANGDTVRVFTE